MRSTILFLAALLRKKIIKMCKMYNEWSIYDVCSYNFSILVAKQNHHIPPMQLDPHDRHCKINKYRFLKTRALLRKYLKQVTRLEYIWIVYRYLYVYLLRNKPGFFRVLHKHRGLNKLNPKKYISNKETS